MPDVLEAIAAHWDEQAASFDDEADHGLTVPETRSAWARRLDEWLPSPPARIADLGCGTGSLSVLLASRGYEVVASDISSEMVERVRRKAERGGVHVDVTVADAAQPPVPKRSTDAVLIRHLAWTLPNPQSAIATWASLLRRGGRLVMVEGRWGPGVQRDGSSTDDGADHEGYALVRQYLPWHGGVAADTLVPLLERTFPHVGYHDLSGDADLWGGSVSDERYAAVAHLG